MLVQLNCHIKLKTGSIFSTINSVSQSGTFFGSANANIKVLILMIYTDFSYKFYSEGYGAYKTVNLL